MEKQWEKECNNLYELRKKIEIGGGEKRINKQHSINKHTAKERLDILFDEGTFIDFGDMVTSQSSDFGMNKKKVFGDGVIVGYGYINGRLVFASSQDFTVCGGSMGKAHTAKICNAIKKAIEVKAPFVFINDSGGARIEEGINSLNGCGKILRYNTEASGLIPQISVILGPCAGAASYSPAITDFIFMTKENSQMFLTGPSVVKSVTGENISPNDLGGAEVHNTESGVSHFVYNDEISCLKKVRELLSYLPQNFMKKPPNVKTVEIDETNKIMDIVPANSKKIYNVIDVIKTFADNKDFFEIQKDFARNIVIGFIRLNGSTIGIIANQSNYLAGAIDSKASDKASRFIRFCDSFNIPLLTLVDVPAFLPGINEEHNGIIKHGAKLIYAFSESTVPKICLIMRKSYGGAYIAMNSKATGADLVFAWPIAEIAVMGASGAVSIINGKEIENYEDPKQKSEELIKEYNEKFMNPFIAVKRGYVDKVIMPWETKKCLAEAFKMLEHKNDIIKANKKHGNIPL